MLVPAGDAQALAECLRELWDEPQRLRDMGRAASADVERFAWPKVAEQVMEAYEDAIATPQRLALRESLVLAGCGRSIAVATSR